MCQNCIETLPRIELFKKFDNYTASRKNVNKIEDIKLKNAVPHEDGHLAINVFVRLIYVLFNLYARENDSSNLIINIFHRIVNLILVAVDIILETVKRHKT